MSCRSSLTFSTRYVLPAVFLRHASARRSSFDTRFIQVAEHKETNLMNPSNLAIVFSPILLINQVRHLGSNHSL